MPAHLAILYNVGKTSINRILRYNKPERACPNRTGLAYKLNNAQVNWIIKYFSKTYKQRTLNWV
jgi:hypothetical protein